MGRDKALLPFRGRTLLEHTAGQVRQAAGNVTIIADPARYAHLGLPVVADLRPGCGPLAGVVTALSISGQPWNLIVACDMPNLDSQFLESLITVALTKTGQSECVAPAGLTNVEPLCAVYHRSALPTLERALDRGQFAMWAVLESLKTFKVPVKDERRFSNLNTPEDLAAHG